MFQVEVVHSPALDAGERLHRVRHGPPPIRAPRVWAFSWWPQALRLGRPRKPPPRLRRKSLGSQEPTAREPVPSGMLSTRGATSCASARSWQAMNWASSRHEAATSRIVRISTPSLGLLASNCGRSAPQPRQCRLTGGGLPEQQAQANRAGTPLLALLQLGHALRPPSASLSLSLSRTVAPTLCPIH